MTHSVEYGLHVLAFGPHPDDVELFCGGLMIRMAELGYRTGVVDLTRGEKSSRGTPETRAAETDAATRVMGLAVRENLGLPDGWVDPMAGAHLTEEEREKHAPVSRVVEVLRRLRPELVVIPWERERHPDHEASSAVLTRALYFSSVRKFAALPGSEPFTPRQVLLYPMRHLGEPTFVVDVSSVHARKMEAIRCYASQVQPRADAPVTLVGSQLSLSSLEARDQFYGAQIGVSHGEPYIIREVPGLADPVDHFRRNSFARPLFFPGR
ncbi:MAG: bacillithiol biosynthesis deacetylase BshB1 [Myxococcota bacterium]